MNRKRALLCCTALGLAVTGCLGPGTTRPTRLFVLNATVARDAPADTANPIRLGVGRILIPELLNRPQIVTRTSENKVELADFSQWAEPLERSIPVVLAENLARLTGSDQVSVYPWPTQIDLDLRVEIAIIEFEGDTDGIVTLVARWRLVRPGGSEALPLRLSTHTESATDRSTEAQIAAMSRALASLSRDIAAAIASIAR